MAVLISLFAAGVSTFQAWQTQKSADVQLEASRRSAADQLVLVGREASRPTGGLSAKAPSWGVLGNEPTLVQNYGRLPVSSVVVEIHLLYRNGDARTLLVPIGVLPPCRETQIVEDLEPGRPISLRDVERVRLRVRFTDAAGQEWVRSTTGLPEAASNDTSDRAERWGGLNRSAIRLIAACSPS